MISVLSAQYLFRHSNLFFCSACNTFSDILIFFLLSKQVVAVIFSADVSLRLLCTHFPQVGLSAYSLNKHRFQSLLVFLVYKLRAHNHRSPKASSASPWTSFPRDRSPDVSKSLSESFHTRAARVTYLFQTLRAPGAAHAHA